MPPSDPTAGPVMLTHLTPDGVRAPFAAYSHAVEVQAGARLVFCSVQLGMSPDDVVRDSAGAQATVTDCACALAVTIIFTPRDRRSRLESRIRCRLERIFPFSRQCSPLP
jgi:hypothetical protein